MGRRLSGWRGALARGAAALGLAGLLLGAGGTAPAAHALAPDPIVDVGCIAWDAVNGCTVVQVIIAYANGGWMVFTYDV